VDKAVIARRLPDSGDRGPGESVLEAALLAPPRRSQVVQGGGGRDRGAEGGRRAEVSWTRGSASPYSPSRRFRRGQRWIRGGRARPGGAEAGGIEKHTCLLQRASYGPDHDDGGWGGSVGGGKGKGREVVLASAVDVSA
jgi:hypothetical protein